MKMINALRRAPNQMYNSKSWWKNSGIGYINKFTKLKKQLIKQGKVIEVDTSTITDADERTRLKIDASPRTKVYALV